MKLPEVPAPKAQKNPTTHTYHGIEISDDYAWLRDPGYPQVSDKAVLQYLEDENTYFNAFMQPYDDLKSTLYEEMKGRIPQEDRSVPVKDGAWLYWWQFEKDAQYRQWYRKAVDHGADQLLLDEVERAQGHDFYQLGDLSVSPDGKSLAISEDVTGDERYTIRARPIDGGEWQVLAAGASGHVVWDAASKGLLFVELNENHRPYLVKYVALNQAQDAQALYEEKDDSFFVGIGRTQSRKYLMISAGDHVTSETRLIPADNPLAPHIMVAARLAGREYDVDHAGDRLFIRTNDTHKNFRIVTADEKTPNVWDALIAPSDTRYIRGLVSFKDRLVVEERINGLDQIFILPHDGGDGHHIAFPEDTYTVGLGSNPEYDMGALRLGYQSMVTPPTVYEYDVRARRLTAMKVQTIPSGYDKDQFATERLMARAEDGTLIPISIVYKKGFQKDGSAPLHLYGYGAYGIGMSPGFSTARLSLLDRGFAFAIAHIRGGDEMGYGWYQDGKLFKRWQTFTDFVSCAKHLIDFGYARAGGISISGGSAGGTLMGVAANIAPKLWSAVVAHVPFVDVLNTMLDGDLPLTPIEWPEWGNPITDRAAFALIRSYSPYDNVMAQDYPPIMVTAGLNDPRVTYWEPAKWVARLRAMKNDQNALIFKTNMGAGHRGKTGRYAALEEVAEEYTFLLCATERGS